MEYGSEQEHLTRDMCIDGLMRLREGYANDDDRTPYDTLTVIIKECTRTQ